MHISIGLTNLIDVINKWHSDLFLTFNIHMFSKGKKVTITINLLHDDIVENNNTL